MLFSGDLILGPTAAKIGYVRQIGMVFKQGELFQNAEIRGRCGGFPTVLSVLLRTSGPGCTQ
jgi:hypothetical protein